MPESKWKPILTLERKTGLVYNVARRGIRQKYHVADQNEPEQSRGALSPGCPRITGPRGKMVAFFFAL